MSTEVERAAARIISLQAQKDEIEEAIKNQKAFIAARVETGTTQEGDFEITSYVNTRFDDGFAKKNLTEEEYASIAVPKADSKRATALLAPERLALTKKTFDTVIKVSLRDD